MAKKPTNLNSDSVQLTPVTPGDLVGIDDAIAVTLDDFKILHLLSKNEKNNGGMLVINMGGNMSYIIWSENLQNINTKELLYLGKPEGLLPIHVQVIESDSKERGAVKKVKAFLKWLPQVTKVIPIYGDVTTKALNVGGALANLVRAEFDDDTELRFDGSLINLEGVSPPTDSALNYGKYNLVRKCPDGNIHDDPTTGKPIKGDIQISFTVHEADITAAGSKHEVVVVLEKVDMSLEEEEMDDDDTLMIDTKFASGTGKKRVEKTFAFTTDYENSKHLFNKISGMKNQLLYRGPYQGGISLSLGIAAAKKGLSEEWQAVLEQATNPTNSVTSIMSDPEEKKTPESITKTVETARTTIMKFVPDGKRRFAVTHNGALILADKDADTVADTVADTDGNSPLHSIFSDNTWHNDIVITVKIPGYGEAVFHLLVMSREV